MLTLVCVVLSVALSLAADTADHSANSKTRQVLNLIADMPNRGKLLPHFE
jgi:hypothetical protein